MEKLEGINYMTEGGAGTLAYKERAEENLKIAKEIEAQKSTIPVWIDFQTTKFMDLEKIKRKKLEIIKVKLKRGGLVWMERKTAIENGFINE